jgi:putative peptidoglycan lipid II flippase
LFYADRLYELPLAMVGIAIGVVLLPEVSRHLKSGDTAAVMDSQNRALELALLLTVPAATALAIIPHELISVVYERGSFRAADTAAVAAALAVFALGLPAFVMIKVFSPAFFAREDTRTPMRFAAWSLAINTALSIGLFFLFRELGLRAHVGIAVATAVGGWLNAWLLWRELARRGEFVADARLKRAIPAILVASAVMAAALLWLVSALAPWLAPAERFWTRLGAAGVVVGAGALVYFAVGFVTGALRFAALKSMFRRAR